MCAKVELWNNFVAIRMEYPQVIDYTLKIINSRTPTIKLQFVIVRIGLFCKNVVAIII